MKERRRLVEDAQRSIAKVLAALEKETDCYVEGLCIRDTEITSLADAAPVMSRQVLVDLRRAPGSQWQT